MGTAVATKGPVSISVAAGGIGWQLYFGGIMSGSKNFDMDHAVQLVGYGTDNGKEPCGTDSTPQDGDACAGDKKPRTYCGECGILSSSSYPTGLKKASNEVVV